MTDATRAAADLPSTLAPGRLFIGGEWVEAASGKTFAVVNPAKAEILTEVAAGDVADIDRAVAAARLAFDSGAWPGLPPRKRARILWDMARLLEERKDEIARVETLQNGKPVFESGNVRVFRHR